MAVGSDLVAGSLGPEDLHTILIESQRPLASSVVEAIQSRWENTLSKYAGDASLYQNTDFRFKLFDFTTYISKAEFGILAFNDIGRVWLGGEDSDIWHHGYGGGLWTSPFQLSVLTATFERSRDEPSGLFSFRFSFLF